MQRLPTGIIAVVSLLTLTAAPACKGGQDDSKASDGAKTDADKSASGDKAPEAEGGEPAEAGDPPAEGGPAQDTGAEVGGEAGAEAGAEGGAETAAEAGAPAGETGAEVAPPEGETGEEDPVPAMLESAQSLDTDDATAKKTLEDAIAAGAAKLDAAKAANARGELLKTKGENERAEAFFIWARDAHSLYAAPVYNLATIAAYAGDLEIAKEHLMELKKRGNKKLMKKVGVDPAFAPLHDDPEVRKIYEQ